MADWVAFLLIFALPIVGTVLALFLMELPSMLRERDDRRAFSAMLYRGRGRDEDERVRHGRALARRRISRQLDQAYWDRDFLRMVRHIRPVDGVMELDQAAQLMDRQARLNDTIWSLERYLSRN